MNFKQLKTLNKELSTVLAPRHLAIVIFDYVGSSFQKIRAIIHLERRMPHATAKETRQIYSMGGSIAPMISASFCPRRPFQRRRMIKSPIESHLFSPGYPLGHRCDGRPQNENIRTKLLAQSIYIPPPFHCQNAPPFLECAWLSSQLNARTFELTSKHRLTKKIRVRGLTMKRKHVTAYRTVQREKRSL